MYYKYIHTARNKRSAAQQSATRDARVHTNPHVYIVAMWISLDFHEVSFAFPLSSVRADATSPSVVEGTGDHVASEPEVLGKVVDRKVSMRKWLNYSFAPRAELTIPLPWYAYSSSVLGWPGSSVSPSVSGLFDCL